MFIYYTFLLNSGNWNDENRRKIPANSACLRQGVAPNNPQAVRIGPGLCTRTRRSLPCDGTQQSKARGVPKGIL